MQRHAMAAKRILKEAKRIDDDDDDDYCCWLYDDDGGYDGGYCDDYDDVEQQCVLKNPVA